MEWPVIQLNELVNWIHTWWLMLPQDSSCMTSSYLFPQISATNNDITLKEWDMLYSYKDSHMLRQKSKQDFYDSWLQQVSLSQHSVLASEVSGLYNNKHIILPMGYN